MIPYIYRDANKAERDRVAAKLAAKGATVVKKQVKRIIKPSVLLREDKEDPEKITGIREGEPEEIDYYILESDLMPWECDRLGRFR